MNYPGLAAEMADLLLRMKEIRWVVCLGAYKNELILSVRTEDQRKNAGRLVQEIVGDLGTAGGHGMMAGGQVPLREHDPERLALQLGWEALQHLSIEPSVEGKPIV
jgi:nanoRNase/pAp phosphatase (c-di-AMP/oligoRNAs hydrolase)